MNYFKNIYIAISTLMTGMKLTLGYFVRPREYVTLQYPDEVWPIPERNIGTGELASYNVIRSKLHVDIDDCIGCKKCERACPVGCISIDVLKGDKGEDLGVTKNGTSIKLVVTKHQIDMSECMFCDLCTHPCPEDCIYMEADYRFERNDNKRKDVTVKERWRDRSTLIYDFAKIAQEDVDARTAKIEEENRLKAEEKEKAMAEKLAAAAAKQTAKADAEQTQNVKADVETTLFKTTEGGES